MNLSCMIKIICFYTLFLSTISFNSNSQNLQVLNVGLLRRIVNIKYDGYTQTGFFYHTSDGKNLLITAKHLFKKSYLKKVRGKTGTTWMKFDSLSVLNGQKITFSISDTIGWKEYSGKVYFHENSKIDIAVIWHNIPVETSSNLNLGFANILLGQECFFAGFPLGLKINNTVALDGWSFPLIKKGVISAILPDPSGFDVIYVDGNNTFGLSGAPLIYFDNYQKIFKVAGVISGYLPQVKIDYDSSGKSHEVEENSGIFIAHSILSAQEIINQIH